MYVNMSCCFIMFYHKTYFQNVFGKKKTNIMCKTGY